MLTRGIDFGIVQTDVLAGPSISPRTSAFCLNAVENFFSKMT